jgi:hypothetical protein
VVAVVAVGTCVKQLAVTTPSILNYKSLWFFLYVEFNVSRHDVCLDT